MLQERMDRIAENPEKKRRQPDDPYSGGKFEVEPSETAPLDQNDPLQKTERLAEALYSSAK